MLHHRSKYTEDKCALRGLLLYSRQTFPYPVTEELPVIQAQSQEYPGRTTSVASRLTWQEMLISGIPFCQRVPSRESEFKLTFQVQRPMFLTRTNCGFLVQLGKFEKIYSWGPIPSAPRIVFNVPQSTHTQVLSHQVLSVWYLERLQERDKVALVLV
jgi:hypothetical protein